ncbi:TRAP-type C4-dicarboxylate transport system, small permease component [Thalassovita gelatinovora]|uniref:TRAP transporter small permease protein n=1 Tax=Thalassovita gelatinovora TaxID=53501 RepID=A0A0P1F9H9_THAGE|nr:TRAP transporter small permease [Thalassovita gelatinovora]QIZ81227.1 TRAP transporter small permease [Thalassovita gelatinovora]CUH64669.1 TRAP-type C4-dicarboxylate transport system, small permease component [Thalassovita gelatinovora]SEP93943.1 TRAP-type mannitol/chloroaromatic compound transport system, small permease component [Thalassovita gelatinovora]
MTQQADIADLTRLGKAAVSLMRVANVVATLWIFGLMVLIVTDILGRELFGHPIAGVPEMVKYSIVGIVFLQIAHTHRAGQMIRSDGILGMIRKVRPRLAAAMDLAAQICGAGFAATLGWAVWPKAVRAYERGELEGISGHFTMPVWPFLGLIVLGSALLSVSFLMSAAAALQQARKSS